MTDLLRVQAADQCSSAAGQHSQAGSARPARPHPGGAACGSTGVRALLQACCSLPSLSCALSMGPAGRAVPMHAAGRHLATAVTACAGSATQAHLLRAHPTGRSECRRQAAAAGEQAVCANAETPRALEQRCPGGNEHAPASEPAARQCQRAQGELQPGSALAHRPHAQLQAVQPAQDSPQPAAAGMARSAGPSGRRTRFGKVPQPLPTSGRLWGCCERSLASPVRTESTC